jgi:hypothetical protein
MLDTLIPELTIDDVRPYLKDQAALSLLSLAEGEIKDFPNVFVRSNSVAVSRAYALALSPSPSLSLSKPSYQTTSVEGVRSCASHFEVIIHNGNLIEATEYCAGICKVGSCYYRSENRHTFLIYIMSPLGKGRAACLRALLLDHQANAWFVVISNPDTPVCTAIRETCTVINLCKFDLERFAIDRNLLLGGSRDPLDLLISAQREAGKEKEVAMLDAFVRARFNAMLNSWNSKAKDREKEPYQEQLKDFCVRIGASCIPIKRLGFSILSSYLHCLASKEENGKEEKDKQHELLHLVTKMEHMCRISSKQIFALEYYIDACIRCIAFSPPSCSSSCSSCSSCSTSSNNSKSP